MKKIFTLLLVIASQITFAQKIEVKEGVEKVGDGHNSCLTVMIYEADKDDILKEWKSLMKDYKPEDISKKDGVEATDAHISEISTLPLDVYAVAEQVDGNVKLMVGLKIDIAFLSSKSHPSEFKAAKNIVLKFAQNQQGELIDDQIKDAEKELEKREKAQEKLEKKNESLKSNIEKWKADIEQAEQDLITNEEEQKTQKTIIEEQKKEVEIVKAKKASYF